MGITIGHFILPILLIFLSYSTGYVLIKNRIPNDFLKLKSFFSFFIGLITLVFITSLFVTKGITIHIVFLVPIAFFIVKHKKKGLTITDPFKIYDFLKGFKQIFILYLIWCFIYILIAYFNYINQDIERYLYNDIYHYARLSDVIWMTGEENFLGNINYNSLFEGGTAPYHYFELYVNMILSEFFKINSLWSYVISVPIVLLTLGSSLLYSILSEVKKTSKWQNYIYAIILLFISGTIIVPLEYVHEGNFATNIINQVTPRYILIYISFVLSSFFIFKKKYYLSLFPLVFLQIVSFVMVPSVSFAIFFGISLLYIFKLEQKKIILNMLLIQVTSVISIFIFYKYTQIPKVNDGLEFSYSVVIDGVYNNYLSIIKYIIASSVYLLQYYSVFLIPLCILIFIQFKRNIKTTKLIHITFLIILIEGGILVTSLLFGHHPEFFQPEHYSVVIGCNVILFWMFIFSITSKIKGIKVLTIILILVSGNNIIDTVLKNFSVPYNNTNIKRGLTNEFFDEFNKNDRYTIGFVGFLNNYSEIENIKPVVYPIGNTLLNYNSGINLEAIDSRIINTKLKHLKNTNYSIFSQNNKNSNQESILKQFLLENNINYFIGFEKDKIDKYLLNNSVEIIIDNHSGLFLRKIKIKY